MNKRSIRKKYKRKKQKTLKKQKGGGGMDAILLGLLDEKYVTLPSTKCIKDKDLLQIFLNSVTAPELFSLIGKNEKFVEFVIDDSIKFLSSFNKNIDFLYLDSLDGQFKEASDHQLKEIKVAQSKLHKKSLVLLDDKGSKTNLSIDFMLKNNFKIINETREQVLLGYE